MCGFDRRTTVPCSLLALLPFPAFDTNAHTCSVGKCDKRITRRVFFCPTPNPLSTPLNIWHTETKGMRFPHLSADTALRTLAGSDSASYSRLSAFPSVFSFLHVYVSCVLCILGIPLDQAKLRSHPRRLQYSFHCPALYDSFFWEGCLCVFYFEGLTSCSFQRAHCSLLGPLWKSCTC